MAQDFEQMLKDVLGESYNKLTGFRSEQVQKLTSKIQELAREAVQPELSRLSAELSDLRNRIAEMEAERVREAAEHVEPGL
jgi:hypothetical protein